jgi:transcription-repair coupling factor (superfamily II helicase)
MFGLSQLYQLRGRVGRSDRQAFAVFLYRDAESLTEIARQRLAALREFSQLGAGQKIALRDLELRGAGSLLGLEQSGPVAAVGLDLYLRLLESSVRQLQGKKASARLISLPSVELPVSSSIPADYIPSDQERLRLYDRMASVRTENEISRLHTEVEAQYGRLPLVAERAFHLLRLRVRCQAAGVKSITFENERVSLILRKGHVTPDITEPALREALGDRLESVTADRVVLTVSASDALGASSAAVDVLADALARRRAARPAPSRKRGVRKEARVSTTRDAVVRTP